MYFHFVDLTTENIIYTHRFVCCNQSIIFISVGLEASLMLGSFFFVAFFFFSYKQNNI